MSHQQKPIVLSIAGHDPSGGAGIQADIESIAQAGCHAVTVITALTIQNTQKVFATILQKPEPFRQHIQAIFADMEIAACKIGLLGAVDLIDVIYEQLSNKAIPIVFDPIIDAGSGAQFSNEAICTKMRETLLPITTIITPNSLEARALANVAELSTAAATLLQFGAQSVLISGTHEHTENVINTFYEHDQTPINYRWRRLASTFHGSGCTLSANIAAQLACGKDLQAAIEHAQQYTWDTLQHGLKLGRDQYHPNRFFNNEAGKVKQ